MNSINKTARMAGFLYLIYIVASIFANGLGRSKLIVLGDAATTAGNIMASAWQFRIGFVIDLIAGVLFLLTAWALYVLLKPVNKNIALLFLLLNLGGVAVSCFRLCRKITFRIRSMLAKQVGHDQVYRGTASHENNEEETNTSMSMSCM